VQLCLSLIAIHFSVPRKVHSVLSRFSIHSCLKSVNGGSSDFRELQSP
jgi:hypothetical protein